MQALDHLGGWHHIVHTPAVGGTYIHVFDESQHHAAAFEVARHGKYFLVIGAPFDNHVDFDRAQSCGLGCMDTLQYIGNRETHIVHAAKNRIVQSIQADGHPAQSGIFESLGLAR